MKRFNVYFLLFFANVLLLMSCTDDACGILPILEEEDKLWIVGDTIGALSFTSNNIVSDFNYEISYGNLLVSNDCDLKREYKSLRVFLNENDTEYISFTIANEANGTTAITGSARVEGGSGASAGRYYIRGNYRNDNSVYYDNIVINGTEYNDVIRFDILASNPNSTSNTSYIVYLAYEVGLVSFEKDGVAWFVE